MSEPSLINNGIFWTGMVTALIGCLLKTMSMAYKSKCKEVSFCCIKIIRDVKAEVEENKFVVSHIPTNQSSQNDGNSPS